MRLTTCLPVSLVALLAVTLSVEASDFTKEKQVEIIGALLDAIGQSPLKSRLQRNIGEFWKKLNAMDDKSFVAAITDMVNAKTSSEFLSRLDTALRSKTVTDKLDNKAVDALEKVLYGKLNTPSGPAETSKPTYSAGNTDAVQQLIETVKSAEELFRFKIEGFSREQGDAFIETLTNALGSSDVAIREHLSAMSKTTHGSTFMSRLKAILESPKGAQLKNDIVLDLKKRVEKMIHDVDLVMKSKVQKTPMKPVARPRKN